MRIYAVADIHAKPDHMSAIFSTVDQYRPDLLIAAGDLTHFFRWSTCLAQLDSLPVPVMAIRGNTDFKRTLPQMERAANITVLTRRPVEQDGIRILGLSGALLLPFASRISWQETQALATLPAMDANTILVVHPPPKGTLDRVAGKIPCGSAGLRDCIKTQGPGLVLCGHIHEAHGSAMLGRTTVVNCAMGKKSHGAIIDMEKDSPPKVTVLHPRA